jgi:hypothetical protein
VARIVADEIIADALLAVEPFDARSRICPREREAHRSLSEAAGLGSAI